MMEYEEYDNPAIGENMDGENNVGQHEDTEMMMDDDDIPVTQEDAWAVIRYVIYVYTSYRKNFTQLTWQTHFLRIIVE